MTAPITRPLVEFAATARVDEPDALHAGRRAVLGALSLAAGASTHSAVTAAVGAFRGLAPTPAATVMGSGDRLGMAWAAAVNGIGAHIEDFDDTTLPSVIHPGAPIVPAALAVAEHVAASGREFLEAVTVGIEVAIRLAESVAPGHIERGWHVTGTMGPIGAAIAAGRLLGLDADELEAAFAIAAAQAAGLQEAFGTMTKSLHPGRAAANGVEAALLAHAGLTAPRDAFECDGGFADAMAPSLDPGRALDGLGETWSIVRNAFKPYSCGIVAHPAIDAAIAFRKLAGAEEVAAIDLRVHPLVLVAMGKEDPTTGLDAKFSVFHAVAVGLLHGAAAPIHFTDAMATDPAVRRLRQKVRARVDQSVGLDEVYASLMTAAGVRDDYHVAHATGSADRPMTDEQLRAKANLVAAPVLGDQGVQLLCDAVFEVDSLRSIRELVRAGVAVRPR